MPGSQERSRGGSRRWVSNYLKQIGLLTIAAASGTATASPGTRPAAREAEGPGARAAARSRVFRVKPLGGTAWALESISAKGAFCNGGFIVTGQGVVLVDAFARPQAARQALRIIATVTPQPVRYLVYTHHHFDHVGGSTVFSRKTRIVAHENVASHLKRYNPTRARMPDLVYRNGLQLTSGPHPVLLLHAGRGHSNADTFVYLPNDGILFTGDMVVHKDVGYFGQARVLEWIWTLRLLSVLPIKTVVPGHGPVGGRAVLDDFIGYLEYMYGAIRRFNADGLPDAAVLRRFSLRPPYDTWAYARERTRGTVKRILKELRSHPAAHKAARPRGGNR